MILEPWAHASPVTGTMLRGWCTPPTGRPLLHVLHGNGFCGRVYEPMLQALAADFDLWLCDLPGHGDSDAMARFPGWNLFAQAALESARTATARYGAVPRVALGHSLGGVLTALMLGEPGQPFQRAVLLDPVLFPPAMLLAMRLGLARFNPLARASRRRRRQWPDRAAAARALHGRGTYKGWTDEALQAFAAHALRDDGAGGVTLKCAPELEAAIFASGPRGLWPAVKRVAAPTLIAHGRDTMPFVLAGARHARALNPRAIATQAVDGGHCFMQQHPADAAALARRHLLG
ncbi:MAG: alpha/beta fold hydrolase [Roseateles sp.]|uniref:alpha/beta fold hydrolase n=1 Tax=Roseateles sp. TaxID=1971397 RepID=UPI0039E94AE4